jgi:hypothetical protein
MRMVRFSWVRFVVAGMLVLAGATPARAQGQGNAFSPERCSIPTESSPAPRSPQTPQRALHGRQDPTTRATADSSHSRRQPGRYTVNSFFPPLSLLC